MLWFAAPHEHIPGKFGHLSYWNFVKIGIGLFSTERSTLPTDGFSEGTKYSLPKSIYLQYCRDYCWNMSSNQSCDQLGFRSIQGGGLCPRDCYLKHCNPVSMLLFAWFVELTVTSRCDGRLCDTVREYA